MPDPIPHSESSAHVSHAALPRLVAPGSASPRVRLTCGCGCLVQELFPLSLIGPMKRLDDGGTSIGVLSSGQRFRAIESVEEIAQLMAEASVAPDPVLSDAQLRDFRRLAGLSLLSDEIGDARDSLDRIRPEADREFADGRIGEFHYERILRVLDLAEVAVRG